MKRKIPFRFFTLLVLVLLLPFALAQTGAKQSPAAGQQSSSSTKSSATASSKIDINSATKNELQTLPGVGDATAQKIIDHRPYKAKNELLNKKIVPKTTYDKIKEQIVARQKKPS